MNTRLLLGIDGGGTKTEAVIATRDGTVLGQGLAAGANPHNTDTAAVVNAINQAVAHSLAAAHLEKSQTFSVAVVGLAGLDSAEEIAVMKAVLAPHIHASHLMVANDGLIAFRSGSDKPSGVCLIASTGSSCYGITPNGHVKAGNWGYLMGDQGSGYAIGQSILKHAVKEMDGRQALTPLSQQVQRHFKVDSLAALSQAVYSLPSPVSHIAGLAALTSDEAYMSHPAITAVTQQAVDELFEALTCVVDQLGFAADEKFPLVLSGKLFLAKKLITNPLLHRIDQTFPNTTPIHSTCSPAIGAIAIAQNL